MKRAPPKKLFEEKRCYEEVKEEFDSFMDAAANNLDPKLQELESLYQKKWNIQEERLTKLERERDDLKCERDDLVLKMKNELLKANEDARDALKEAREQFQDEKVTLESYNEYIKKHYETMAAQKEEEYSMEVARLHAKLAEFEKHRADHIQLENQMRQIINLKREVEVLREELQNQKQEFLAQMAEKDVYMKKRIEKEKAELVAENHVLTGKLNAKTMECVQLAREVERACDERNVMNFQVAEAKEKVAPLERKIALLHEQGVAYEQERLKNKQTLKDLQRSLEEQTSKAKSISKELHEARKKVHLREKTIQDYSQDLFEVVFGNQQDNPDHLKQAILNMYDKYVRDTENEKDFENPDLEVLDPSVPESAAARRLPTLEISRQRQSLQRAADVMKKNMDKYREQLTLQRRQSTAENARLLAENKELRRQLLGVERNLAVSEAAAAQLEKEQGQFYKRGKRPPGTSPTKKRSGPQETGKRPSTTAVSSPAIETSIPAKTIKKTSSLGRLNTSKPSRSSPSKLSSSPTSPNTLTLSLARERSLRNLLRPSGKGF